MLSSRNAQYGSGRPRSGTAGSQDEPTAPVAGRPGRPHHFRSRSYLSNLSPIDPKPRNASTMPTEGSPPMVTNGVTAPQVQRQDVNEEPSGNSPTSLRPKIHLPGHSHRHRYSQEIKRRDGSESVHPDTAKDKPQLHLQHLGLNLPVPIRRTNSHRHTRSEITGYPGMASNDGLLHLAAAGGNKSMLNRISSNLSSKPNDNKPQSHKPHHQHSVSDFHKAWNTAALGAHGMAASARPNLRRRSTSDPRSPPFQAPPSYMQARYGATPHYDLAYEQRQKPMSSVEILLYKAEKERKESEKNLSKADVQRLSTQLAESNVELQHQLQNTNHSAQNLMRRLDDAYDTLLTTASSLEDTISSFQNLCHQSDQLIKNFDVRTADLDREIKRTLAKHKKALFQDRGAKVAKLEDRGNLASDRAEEMSKRLENCRTIVRNFVEREATKRRAWRGVLKGGLWGLCIILLGVFLGFCLWWYKSYGAIVRYDAHEAIALALDSGGRYGQVHDIVKGRVNDAQGEESLKVLRNVPEDVRAVLDDIALRHNGTGDAGCVDVLGVQNLKAAASSPVNDRDDGSLDMLFEKLDLR